MRGSSRELHSSLGLDIRVSLWQQERPLSTGEHVSLAEGEDLHGVQGLIESPLESRAGQGAEEQGEQEGVTPQPQQLGGQNGSQNQRRHHWEVCTAEHVGWVVCVATD